MRKSVKGLTLIIGCLLAISLFTIIGDSLHANEEWWPWVNNNGNGDLENIWVSVWVGNLGYDSETGWTSSSHWFQTQNVLGFDLQHTYQFKHGVWEVLAWNEDGTPDDTRFIDHDGFGEQEQRVSEDGECHWQGGSRGVDCSGEDEGNYWIKAGTAVRAVQNGTLDVSMSAESFFTIDEDD